MSCDFPGAVSVGRVTEPLAGGRPLDLLSLHVPKAFGTSIGEALAHHYGRARIFEDYGAFIEDKPPLDKPVLPASAAVVHGHFRAARYAELAARRRIAFLREPVRRTISHYFFWLVEPRHGNGVHDRLLDEHLGLLDFARLPPIRWFYSDTVFGGCDMVSFDLVGVVEDLGRDWPLFQRLTGITAPLPHANRNRYPGYAEVAKRVLNDATLMRELRRILADDILLYERFV